MDKLGSDTDFSGDQIMKIFYNHKDHIQAEARQKRFKISLNTVINICSFFTFTSDYRYRDHNYLHNPVIKQKSPEGRSWGETMDGVELIYQGIDFQNDFDYYLKVCWSLGNYDKLPSGTFLKMCKELVFELEYGWDDEGELFNPKLQQALKEGG